MLREPFAGPPPGRAINHLPPLQSPQAAVTSGSHSFADILPLLVEGAGTLDRDGGVPEGEVALLHEAGLLHAPLPVSEGDRRARGWGNDPAAAPALLDALRRIGRASLPLGRL